MIIHQRLRILKDDLDRTGVHIIGTLLLIVTYIVGNAAIAEEHKQAEEQETTEKKSPQSWSQRQQVYIDKHFGVIPPDPSNWLIPPTEEELEEIESFTPTLDPQRSARNIQAELDRYTSVPPGINYYGEVARKLGSEPEFLALEPQIRQVLHDLGGFMVRREWVELRHTYREHVTIEQQHWDETWAILSKWWVQHFVPSMSGEQVRELLWDNLRTNSPQVPLHATVGELASIWSQHIREEDRQQLHSILKQEAVRSDLPQWSWLWTLPGMRPSMELIDEMLAHKNNERHRFAIRGLLVLDPYDPRGPKALLQDRRLDLMTTSMDMVDYLRARDDHVDSQRDLFERYAQYIENTTRIKNLLDDGAPIGIELYRVLTKIIPQIPTAIYAESPAHLALVQRLVTALETGTERMQAFLPYLYYYQASQRYQQMLDRIADDP